MTIVVGLGNPGEKYQATRHNVGWMFVDFFARKLELPAFATNKKLFAEVTKNEQFLLIKPQTFMNDSGKAVQAAVKWYSKEFSRDEQPNNSATNNLFVIYDDLDIELGKFKIQYGSGPKIHNGLNSIRDHLGSEQFWSVRIGVDSRNGDRSISGSEYVLQNFSPTQRTILEEQYPVILDQLLEKQQITV